MFDLTNSHSLTDFQRNARGFIQDLKESREPVLITVNGKVEAVLLDPVTFQEMEAKAEREKFIAALREGMKDIEEGRTLPIDEAFAALEAKHGF